MIITATELKNNLGKYLRAAEREDVIITSNGTKVARLTSYGDPAAADYFEQILKERAETYALYPKKATYEEFVKISENSDERFEYIDGQIYLLASPRYEHQKVLGELYGLLYNSFKGKKCKPMLAPFDITLKRNPENTNVVQPDLMVICDLEDNINDRGYYMGVPSLMVEILSENSRGKDSVKKLDLYMSTGVREYWIVNPLNKEVTVFLFENNDVLKNATFKNDERIVSYIFEGLEISLKNIF